MNYIKVIQKTIEYIEDHLPDDITLKVLARNAGYSEYHFSRIFKAQTGMGVMDYVRRRRLVYALSELKTGKTIADISMDFGYDTQGGFTKLFKKVYMATPGEYRINVLSHLKNSIKLVSFSHDEGCRMCHVNGRKAAKNYHGKEDEKMVIKGIESEDKVVFENVLNVADRMFNMTVQGDGKYGYEFWRKKHLETPELMIFAEDANNGRICGLAFGWVDAGSVTLAYAGVEKEYRLQGIGRALVAEMEKRARASGYKGIYLGSSPGEEGFWDKCGYSGCLLIQSQKDSIDDMRKLNPGFDEISAGIYEGYVNQLFLRVPGIDRELQKKYEAALPDCNTIMVYGKRF